MGTTYKVTNEIEEVLYNIRECRAARQMMISYNEKFVYLLEFDGNKVLVVGWFSLDTHLFIELDPRILVPNITVDDVITDKDELDKPTVGGYYIYDERVKSNL